MMKLLAYGRKMATVVMATAMVGIVTPVTLFAATPVQNSAYEIDVDEALGQAEQLAMDGFDYYVKGYEDEAYKYYAEAERLYVDAANTGDPYAIFELGWFYSFYLNDEESAQYCYRIAADMGDPSAKAFLNENFDDMYTQTTESGNTSDKITAKDVAGAAFEAWDNTSAEKFEDIAGVSGKVSEFADVFGMKKISKIASGVEKFADGSAKIKNFFDLF